MQWSERRTEDRWKHLSGTVVSLDGFPARIQDLSPQGARVEFGRAVSQGETLRLDLPWGSPVRAIVLAQESTRLRLKLESPIDCW